MKGFTKTALAALFTSLALITTSHPVFADDICEFELSAILHHSEQITNQVSAQALQADILLNDYYGGPWDTPGVDFGNYLSLFLAFDDLITGKSDEIISLTHGQCSRDLSYASDKAGSIEGLGDEINTLLIEIRTAMSAQDYKAVESKSSTFKQKIRSQGMLSKQISNFAKFMMKTRASLDAR